MRVRNAYTVVRVARDFFLQECAVRGETGVRYRGDNVARICAGNIAALSRGRGTVKTPRLLFFTLNDR